MHCVWLDFDSNSDGNLDSVMLFLRRARELHPLYSIRVISKWDDCISAIDRPWIRSIVENKNIGAAHRSDVLRFYYLYTHGGVWIDISTFFVSSVDELVEKNGSGFTCFYIPSDIGQSWMVKPVSALYDLVSLEQFNAVVSELSSGMSARYAHFPYVPENYFLISAPKHPIVLKVLRMFKSFYGTADLSSKDKVRTANCRYTFELFISVFSTNSGIPQRVADRMNGRSYSDSTDALLSGVFDGGYLFNYLMLLISIAEHTRDARVIVVPSTTRATVVKETGGMGASMCRGNACYDLEIRGTGVRLLSASYSRLGKWSDNIEQRISWEGTVAGRIIFGAASLREACERLSAIGIHQLKFGSWTRNSPVVQKLSSLSGLSFGVCIRKWQSCWQSSHAHSKHQSRPRRPPR